MSPLLWATRTTGLPRKEAFWIQRPAIGSQRADTGAPACQASPGHLVCRRVRRSSCGAHAGATTAGCAPSPSPSPNAPSASSLHHLHAALPAGAPNGIPWLRMHCATSAIQQQSAHLGGKGGTPHSPRPGRLQLVGEGWLHEAHELAACQAMRKERLVREHMSSSCSCMHTPSQRSIVGENSQPSRARIIRSGGLRCGPLHGICSWVSGHEVADCF